MVNLQKSELEAKQVFEFVGYQYDLVHRLVKPTQNCLESLLQKVSVLLPHPSCKVREFMSLIGLLTATEKQVPLGRLHMRPIQWHLKRNWRIPESLEKEIPVPKTSPTPQVVDQGRKCPTRPTPTPNASCHSGLYRHLKRRLGCSLRQFHSKRHLVSSRKSITHKLSRIKGRLAGLKKVQTLCTESSASNCHRQDYSCGIHQQGGRYEVRFTLCPSLALPVLVQSETYCPKGQTHSRPSDCDCGQTVPTRSDNPDRMVPSPGVRPPVPNLAQTTGRHVCDQIQLQIDQVCVPSPGPERLGSGCSNSLLGGSRHICIPSSIPSGKSNQQTVGSSLPKSNPDSPRLAQHAMVLGSSGSLSSDTHLSPEPPRSGDSTVQWCSPQGSSKPRPSRLAPRAEAIKEQGFSNLVALRIEAPQSL